MKGIKIFGIFLIGLVLFVHPLLAQEIKSPKITDFKWLAGSWVGNGFGGVSQEAWTEPTANSMVGVYKHYQDDKITFYEFLNISETEGEISLKLKHFSPDMNGWEEKEDFVEFPLLRATATKIEFDGLIYELVDANKMEVRLRLKQDEEINIEVFTFERNNE